MLRYVLYSTEKPENSKIIAKKYMINEKYYNIIVTDIFSFNINYYFL